MRLRMRTGVTHQLRAHMAMIGHPILGDARYGGGHAEIGWHYLHAAAIAFDGDAWPTGLVTPFPAHWHPLFEREGWLTIDWAAAVACAR